MSSWPAGLWKIKSAMSEIEAAGIKGWKRLCCTSTVQYVFLRCERTMIYRFMLWAACWRARPSDRASSKTWILMVHIVAVTIFVGDVTIMSKVISLLSMPVIPAAAYFNLCIAFFGRCQMLRRRVHTRSIKGKSDGIELRGGLYVALKLETKNRSLVGDCRGVARP